MQNTDAIEMPGNDGYSITALQQQSSCAFSLFRVDQEQQSSTLQHKVHPVCGREQQWRTCSIAQLVAGVGRKPPVLHSDEFPNTYTSTVQQAAFASASGRSGGSGGSGGFGESGESGESGRFAAGKSAAGGSAAGALWKEVCESVRDLHDDSE